MDWIRVKHLENKYLREKESLINKNKIEMLNAVLDASYTKEKGVDVYQVLISWDTYWLFMTDDQIRDLENQLGVNIPKGKF